MGQAQKAEIGHLSGEEQERKVSQIHSLLASRAESDHKEQIVTQGCPTRESGRPEVSGQQGALGKESEAPAPCLLPKPRIASTLLTPAGLE